MDNAILVSNLLLTTFHSFRELKGNIQLPLVRIHYDNKVLRTKPKKGKSPVYHEVGISRIAKYSKLNFCTSTTIANNFQGSTLTTFLPDSCICDNKVRKRYDRHQNRNKGEFLPEQSSYDVRDLSRNL